MCQWELKGIKRKHDFLGRSRVSPSKTPRILFERSLEATPASLVWPHGSFQETPRGFLAIFLDDRTKNQILEF